MYLVRRVFRVKPGTARKAAQVIALIGKAYEQAGMRSPSRVYVSGGSVPGPANTVYMDWTEEALMSPYREGLTEPEAVAALYPQLSQVQEESYIEFFEMVEAPKAG